MNNPINSPSRHTKDVSKLRYEESNSLISISGQTYRLGKYDKPIMKAISSSSLPSERYNIDIEIKMEWDQCVWEFQKLTWEIVRFTQYDLQHFFFIWG
mgnify:FL=1